MTPVLLLTHSTLASTKKCIASIEAQDAPTSLFVIDNDSADGTEEWLSSDEYKGIWQRFSPQLGVSAGWNFGLNTLFRSPVWNASCVLCVNSDTVFPTWFIRELAASGYLYDQATFVTGTETINMADLAVPSEFQCRQPSPDFSAFLIGRSAWEAIGEFDTSMKNWASDIDYHLRAHRLGIPLWRANVLYYHERSTTIRSAPPRERRALEMQADADRMAFYQKWGARVGSLEHAALFAPETFGCENRKAV